MKRKRSLIPDLHYGDIVQVENKSIIGRLNRILFLPHTPFYHTLLIASTLDDDSPYHDDYMILESIGKGTAVGLLSFYEGEAIRILRTREDWQISNTLGEEVVREAIGMGRFNYNYLFYPKILLAVVERLIRFSLPPWKVGDFHIRGRNKEVICTGLVKRAYERAGYHLFPAEDAPLPAQFQKALDKGILIQVYPIADKQ